MFKFSLNQFVETNDGAVGIVTSREETAGEDNVSTSYDVTFIGEEDVCFFENELKRTTKQQTTTLEGLTQEQVDEENKQKEEKKERREKADALLASIQKIKNRYHGKCSNGEVFWQLYNEDLEALIYKEMGADKGETFADSLKRCTYGGTVAGCPFYSYSVDI